MNQPSRIGSFLVKKGIHIRLLPTCQFIGKKLSPAFSFGRQEIQSQITKRYSKEHKIQIRTYFLTACPPEGRCTRITKETKEIAIYSRDLSQTIEEFIASPF